MPESPGLMSTTDSESTVSLYGTKPGKEDPSPHAEKVEGSGDSLLIPKALYLQY